MTIAWIVIPPVAYLVGSIPTGYWLTKLLKGQDIRQAGSGNVGATNVARVVGQVPGLIVLLLDLGKGALAVGPLPTWWAGPLPMLHGVRLVAAMAVVLGHVYSCMLRFQGGKGIATALGVLLVLVPQVAGLCAAVWVTLFAWKRYVSLASIAAAVSLPVWLVVCGYAPPVVILGAGLAVLAVYRHQSNIRRLYLGQETKSP